LSYKIKIMNLKGLLRYDLSHDHGDTFFHIPNCEGYVSEDERPSRAGQQKNHWLRNFRSQWSAGLLSTARERGCESPLLLEV
jgi:hypothetical protein